MTQKEADEDNSRHNALLFAVFAAVFVASAGGLIGYVYLPNVAKEKPISKREEVLRAAGMLWGQTQKVVSVAEAQGDGIMTAEAKDVEAQAHRLYSDMAPPTQAQRTSTYLRNGTNFIADYDTTHPLRPTSDYDYGDTPLFVYPEDVKNGSFSNIPHALVSFMPRAYIFPDFFSEEEMQKVITLATPKMKRSEVAKFKNDGKDTQGEGVDEARTSSGAWLNDDAFAKGLKKKISAVTGLPVAEYELFQVLRYERGQRYEAHHDFFDPALYGEQGFNRVATFYTFLTDDFEAGDFGLPRANKGKNPSNLQACQTGLTVKPKRGTAVLFYGMKPDRHLDKYSLHTGCTVGKGTKWSMVLWMQAKGKSYSDDED